jgi:hypothetical protein
LLGISTASPKPVVDKNRGREEWSVRMLLRLERRPARIAGEVFALTGGEVQEICQTIITRGLGAD